MRLTRLPRHDRGPVPGGNRSAASCLCTVLRRALYHYATRSPPTCCCFVGVFCSPFRGLPLLDPLFCLGRAFLALCLVFGLFLGSSLTVTPLCCSFLFVFRPVVLRLSSLRPLCASFGVAGFPFLLFLLCCVVAPLPRWLLSPSPPSVVPLRRPGPGTVLVPPSGYLVASCDGPVALP